MAKRTKKTDAQDSVDAAASEDLLPETPETDADVAGEDSPAAEDMTGDDTSPADTDTSVDEADTDAPEGEDIASGEADDAINDEPDAPADADETLEPAQPAPAPEVIRETVVEQKNGFFPTVFGGIVAAGLGIVGIQYYDSTQVAEADDLTAQLQQTIAEQASQIEALSARLDSVPTVDTAPLEAGVSDAQAQIEALAGQIGTLEGQIAELMARPVVEDTGEVTVDLSGVNAQIAELSALLDTQKGELAQMVQAAQSEKQDAETLARNTMARAAVTRILVALDSGAPFADALADVEANSDEALPEALAQTASEGVPTIAALSESYPDAARAALAAARSDAPEAGIGGFLTKQLGVRSVAPREGDDPDAVLSRMEAAVTEGRLADALAELDTLPDAAKAPLAAWADQAKLRLTAIGDAEALANSLNSQ